MLVIKLILVIKTLCALFALVALVYLLVTKANRKPMPITFKSLDEEATVYGVAKWASKQLGINYGDPRLRYSLVLGHYSTNLIWFGRIPAEELKLIAPFIDLMIEGKGPPQNLPAEYEDTRPKTLARFKERMLAEGLWP